MLAEPVKATSFPPANDRGLERRSAMYVKRLELTDFRSYAHVEVDLEPGPGGLLGPSGYGKPNFIEALGYVATLGSHRVSTDQPLVRAGAERAVVRCQI